jgi:hypothetical protein
MTWRAVTFVVWGLLALSVAGLWVLAATGQGGVARPGALLRTMMANGYVRAAVLLGWMWLGWHFFAR